MTPLQSIVGPITHECGLLALLFIFCYFFLVWSGANFNKYFTYSRLQTIPRPKPLPKPKARLGSFASLLTISGFR